MSDYSELKILAEYATPGPWVAQHPNAGQRGSEVASEGGLIRFAQILAQAMRCTSPQPILPSCLR